jgi:hypothetical protein
MSAQKIYRVGQNCLQFQNDIENKCNVLRTSHSHQLTDEFLKFCLNDLGYCCSAPPLDATSFDSGYPTTEELVYSAFSEEHVCKNSATCISHTILRGETY